MIELLTVIAVIGVLIGMASLYLRPMEASVTTGGQLVEGLIKQTRAKAAATTTVHRVRPAANDRLVVEHAASCSAGTWIPDPKMQLELPAGVILTDTSWSICFSRRGTASANQVLTLSHPKYGAQQLEVLMGGAVKWLP